MNLKVAIQMDHVSTIDITGDPFVLGLEAQRRGHQLFHYARQLAASDSCIIANVQPWS